MRVVVAAFTLVASFLGSTGCQSAIVLPSPGGNSSETPSLLARTGAAPAVAVTAPSVAAPPAAVQPAAPSPGAPSPAAPSPAPANPAPAAAIAAAAGGTAAPAGSVSGSPGESAAPTHVRLPRSPETPARKTLHPLRKPQLARLAAIEFPDFERQDRNTTERMIEFRHTTRTRPHLGVTVQLAACPRPRPCPSMQLARWNKLRPELLEQLPASLSARPDTRLEIGTREVAGASTISIYELGYASGSDDKDQPSADYIDAYVVYYNDGVNQMRVMAHYLDDTVGGLDQMLAVAPREDLEKLAVAFASYYLHAWN